MSYGFVGRPAGPIARLVCWFDHKRGQPRAAAAGIDLSFDCRLFEDEVFEEHLNKIEALTSTLAVRHLKEAVEQLPAQQREMLLLHVNSGLTYWQIARRLGMPEQAVLTGLSRAYSRLCVELSVDELRR
jgi:DNA-directed RNA polymerase specialized sigma24 family protein